MGQTILKLFTLFYTTNLSCSGRLSPAFYGKKCRIIYGSVDSPNLFLRLLTFLFPLGFLPSFASGFDFRAIFMLIYDCEWKAATNWNGIVLDVVRLFRRREKVPRSFHFKDFFIIRRKDRWLFIRDENRCGVARMSHTRSHFSCELIFDVCRKLFILDSIYLFSI